MGIDEIGLNGLWLPISLVMGRPGCNLRRIARRTTPLGSATISATIIDVTVRFTPPEPPRPPRLEHIRDLWQMHRLHRPQASLTAAIYETDAGRELRVGFNETNLIPQLSPLRSAAGVASVVLPASRIRA